MLIIAVLGEHLLTYADTRYLIGAYRDNEVDATHPLAASIDRIRNSGAPVSDLRLAPLSAADLTQLVVDTLHADRKAWGLLTQVIFERTEGNPFFFTQFLDALHKERLLQHDAKARTWTWELDKIKARDFADNVVDLMVGKLRKLPSRSQEVLQLAACLGNKFDLRSLAAIAPTPDIEEPLAAAIHEGLVMRSDGIGKFLHDRIQQAVYPLIPEAQRSEIHLHIGRVFIASIPADEISERLFDIANQLNRGAALLVDANEKAQVAEINLRAGRKAKASAACASACMYLSAGMALIDESWWRNASA